MYSNLGFSIACTLKIPTSQLSINESTNRDISVRFYFSSQKNVDLVGEVSRAPQGHGKVWKFGGGGGGGADYAHHITTTPSIFSDFDSALVLAPALIEKSLNRLGN